MKKPILLLLILTHFVSYYQNQTINQNFTTKKTHLQTAGYVIKTSFNTIPSDFVYLGIEFSNDWKRTGYYAAGVLGLVLTDKITTKFWHNTIEPAIDYKLPDISLFKNEGRAYTWLKGNDAYMSYPIIGLYLGSLITNNEKGQFASANAVKAIAYSTLVSQLALKTIFGRNRPNRPLDAANIQEPWTNDNLDFFNSREFTVYSAPEASAFPSLHATAFFAIAKVFQMEYDNYWIPYGFMSAIFLADVKGHNHWVSDMVVGGILGTLIGRSIVKSSWKARGLLKEKEKKYVINYIPRVSEEFTGLTIHCTF